MQLDDSQLAAIDFAVASRFAVIAGGAGTGKTTIIKEIAKRVPNQALCAFAGKAAARLREATGFDASTIHRLLRSNGDIFMLESLAGRSVIVDEASMVSSDIMAEIVKRNPARLILVGDHAQLPPVGTGQPFHDLLALRPGCARILTTCYRNSEAIYRAAAAIRVGNMPERCETTSSEHWEILASGTPEHTQAALLENVRRGEIDFAKDIVLCPRTGDGMDNMACTVKTLNADIRAIVNPDARDERIFLNDRVICTKNLPDLDCWNGTTGAVHAIDDAGSVFVRLDTPAQNPVDGTYRDIVQFTKEQAKSLQLAYALTVHKAQGSQYRKVFFVCLSRDAYALLDRALAYTAVTRARESCMVFGQPAALAAAIANCDEKRTVIQELARIEEEGE